MEVEAEVKEKAISLGVPRKTAGFAVAVFAVPLALFVGLAAGFLAKEYCSVETFKFLDRWGAFHALAVIVFITAWFIAVRISCCWSGRRTVVSIISLLVSLGIGGLFLWIFIRYDAFYLRVEYIIAISLIVSAAWAIIMTIVFYSTRKSRVKRLEKSSLSNRVDCLVLCGNCKADMSASHDLVCENCGEAFTLDQLIEANAKRVAAIDSELAITEVSDEA